jgi:hypothetical protein
LIFPRSRASARRSRAPTTRPTRSARSQIGQAIQSGDYDAGAKAAFGAGDLTTGLSLTKLAQDQKSQASFDAQFPSLVGGGQAAATPAAPVASAPSRSLPTFAQGDAIGQYAAAIQGNESGGRYDAVGPTHPKLGPALGAYQVMAANVGPWTQEALGRALTPKEFLADPQAQDAVFRHKFGQYVAQTGSPEDAASMWFTGKPLAQGANARDVLGTTGQRYVDMFKAGLARQGGAPALPATAMTMPGAPPADVPAAGAQPAQFVVPPGNDPEVKIDGYDGTWTRAKVAAAAAKDPTRDGIPEDNEIAAAQKGAGSPAAPAPAAAGAAPAAPAQVQASAASVGLQLSPRAAKLMALMSLPGINEGRKEAAKIALQQELEQSKQPEQFKQFLLAQQNPAFKEFLDRNNKADDKGPRVIKQIGPDGAERSYQYDEQSKSFVPLKITGQSGAQPASVDPSLTGDAFLAQLDPGRAAQVKAIADGKMSPPGGFALRSPQIQALMRDVGQYEPGFDLTTWKARNDTRADFAKGKMAANMSALNTVIGHYATLADKAEALSNSSFTPWNTLTNLVGDKTGNPAIKGFETAKNAVADEIMKVFRQTGGSETEVQAWKKTLDSSSSPAQFKEVISSGLELLNSRLNAVGEQYSKGMGKTTDPVSLLSEHAREVLTNLRARVSGAPPLPAAPAAAPPKSFTGDPTLWQHMTPQERALWN